MGSLISLHMLDIKWRDCESCVYGAMVRKWGPESENDGSSMRFELHTLENNREGRKAGASNLIIIRQCNCISKISYP